LEGKLSKNDSYSYEPLCSSCTESCCYSVDCPPLFPNDLKKLDKIGKNNSDYVQILKLNETQQLKQIKRKPNTNECIFFDKEKNGCGIYEHRPLDCEIYPFDVDVIDGVAWWVVYSCNPNSDWKWAESYLEKFESRSELIELLNCSDIYQTYLSMGFTDKSKPKIKIRKVKLTTTIMDKPVHH